MARDSIIQSFLKKNSITPTRPLPLVHSSESYLIKESLKQGILKTSKCEVFNNENLLYFFVGRPAYKKDAKEEGEYWELPSCIVFKFDVSGSKRVFPFDTGAFNRKKYPNYINMMEMEHYNIDPSEDNINKVIGTFFKSSRDYYRLNPISEEKFIEDHNVDVTDEEMRALYRLIKDRSKKFDDRRFSIEVQFQHEFFLENKEPLLCIVPETYLGSAAFMDWINKYRIILETYPIYPLRKNYYYAAIYEKLENFYRENGYYEV